MCTNNIIENYVKGITLEDINIYLYKKKDNNKVHNLDFKEFFD